MLSKIIANKICLSSLILILAALLLTAYTKQNQSVILKVQNTFLQLGSPLVYAVGSVREYADNKFSDYILLRNVSSENKNLRKELQDLELTNNRLNSLLKDQAQLKRLNRLATKSNFSGLEARVIAYPESNKRKLLMIDRGRRDGVSINQAVVFGRQVIGQIISVSYQSAIIMTVFDPLFGVDAISVKRNVRGTVFGQNTKELAWDFVSKQKTISKEELFTCSKTAEQISVVSIAKKWRAAFWLGWNGSFTLPALFNLKYDLLPKLAFTVSGVCPSTKLQRLPTSSKAFFTFFCARHLRSTVFFL